jgi:tetratricopeptide (TPR) repeat protein
LGRWERVDAFVNEYSLHLGSDEALPFADVLELIDSGDIWLGYLQLKAFLEKFPHNPAALFRSGNFYCRYKAFDRGIKEFDRILSLKGLDSEPLQKLMVKLAISQAAIQLGDLDRARVTLASIEETMGANPGVYPEVEERYMKLSFILLELENKAKAD